MTSDLLHDPRKVSFASDNYSGVHPEVMEALSLANGGHVTSYGADPYTDRLTEVMKGHFGDRAETYPVFNGTGANVVALMLAARPWDAVVCADVAHINNDECGAPEKVGGLKLVPVPTGDGKVTPELLDTKARNFGFEHAAQPRLLSLTQATESGTVYTVEELAAVVGRAKEHGMVVHLDGSRLSNAAAALGVPLRALTTDIGVDLLSLGGTKNGLMGAEAVVVLSPEVVHGPLYVRKLTTQLASKMRFISAQLVALYEGDLWRESAAHANAMAARLAEQVREIPGIRVTQDPQVNAVFAVMPGEAADRLRERYAFYDWDESIGEVRWMCSFDTSVEDVDGFVAAAREVMSS
ncbi:L-threonine aldolase [Austwickia chelonae]|uniref:Putative L-threonine aldolase n=1 Tax=Austwickia chelonae NBRC 105200 TaxID=1184607 RepID=K6W7V0_9MICO|nr:beta-eliminating lyase-related protein [Austwickia chelonae]GAB77917.1 putative L-threonine aldolase [Austwickia chelonae NBRC 105200]SEV92200.1 L-threonine aldolase [Austwickia chelonae]